MRERINETLYPFSRFVEKFGCGARMRVSRAEVTQMYKDSL